MLATATRPEIHALITDPRRLREAVVADHEAGLLSDAAAAELRCNCESLYRLPARAAGYRAAADRILAILVPAA